MTNPPYTSPTTEPYITPREFDMFVRRFDDLTRRIDAMDQGTKGLGPLTVTVEEVRSDVAEHKAEHVRVSNSLRNLVIAMIAQFAAIIGTYLPFTHHK